MCDSENRESAREQRYAVLGTRTPRCPCGETDPFVLTGAYPHIACYEWDRMAHGLARMEAQHVQGRANGTATVPMLGNDHRAVDSYKVTDWPEVTVRNPQANPLLTVAACVRGWLDVLRVILDRTIGWIPAFLEALAVWLDEQLGARWWDELPFTYGPT